MIKLLLDIFKLRVTLVNDSEGSIGMSRQYTRFNQDCLPSIETMFSGTTIVDNHIPDTFFGSLKKYLKANNFAIVSVDTDHDVGTVLLQIKSIEK